MADKCLDINLRDNSGTSQAQRALKALNVGYVLPDERTTEDLLLFAKRYGLYLNYYDWNNVQAGDWSSLMAKDIAVIIAGMQEWRGRDYVAYVNNLYVNIKNATTTSDAQKNFKYIFDLVFSIVLNLNDVADQIPASEEYARFLTASIASKLSIPVSQLYLYYPYFLTTVLSGATTSTADPLSPFDDTDSIPLNAADFHEKFVFLTSDRWKLPANVIIPPASLFAGYGLKEIATNNFFTGAVTSFINGIINIINQTASYFVNSISNYPAHSPHYALYLSFLRLFKFAQDHLNTYTGRHLKFYYKQVLQLKINPGIPDSAHLVFTLQKNFTHHLLKAGTEFKAGKDVNGNQLYYALTNDIVVNKATVQSLKSLYLVKNYKGIPQQLFASPKVDSADGQGAQLKSSDKSWLPFGDLGSDNFQTSGVGKVGFAIASNILYMNEGARKVTITFDCDPSVKSILTAIGTPASADIFSARFTGNKKWFDATDFLIDQASRIVLQADDTSNQFSITVGVSGNAPPIVPYSQKIHGGSFTEALPMVQIILQDYNYYSAIKLLKIISVRIQVNVEGVKNLALQNNAGTLDSAKPFKPFGDFPDNNASLTIGSKEVFQKKLNLLQLNVEWQPSNAPVAGTTVSAVALVEGEWAITAPFDSAVDITPETITLNGAANIPQCAPDFSSNQDYTNSSVNGFIKLLFSNSSNYYTLSNYLATIAASTTKVVTVPGPSGTTDYTVTPPSPPASPHLLVAQSISLTYEANETINLADAGIDNFHNRTDFFYHIEPFGFREMHPYLMTVPDSADDSLRDNMLHVLPVFDLDNDLQDGTDTGRMSGHNNEGELWIGLNNTQPAEVQSILFEVSEGSSNPLKPVANINWFYMSANNWILFDPVTGVNDQTNSLSESGLVIFNLPGDETTSNTRADAGLLWLKAVVKNDTDAICKIISVQANAARVQFVSDAANKIYFTENIVAGTISKPAVADGVLKQTNQPYSSFGGVPKESDAQFDQRVSERLRHKHRAVTMWDYERLILQNFPLIHKVKCINHTSLNTATQGYSEMKPGDVMIVTVPDLSLVTGANPLLPFTSVGLLEEIKKFILPLCSSFVNVNVCNPQFEAVAFNFDVYFINDNSNSGFYTAQLNADIQKFLMPWAFGSSTSDIEFGGKIEKSVVLSFIQSLSYVEFVTCFQMIKYVYQLDGTYKLTDSDADEAIASTARSILVPYYSNHISPTANCKCNG